MRPMSLGSLLPLEAEKGIRVGLFYLTDIKVGSNCVLTQAYPDHPWNKTVDTLGDNGVLLLIYNHTVVMRYHFTGFAAIRCKYLTLIWCNSIAMIHLNNSPLKLPLFTFVVKVVPICGQEFILTSHHSQHGKPATPKLHCPSDFVSINLSWILGARG